MRKLIAGLAGAAMVASMAAPAFASTSTDVKGTSSENAVAQLEALGVVTGDAGTGNFRPNDTITRGEFAVIADRLAGLGSAAQYLGQVDTSFKDVKKDYWGSGWVNVAKNAGLVAGYGDGTFRPDAPVSYAEVATVYLHLLGYQEAHLGGAWPTNDIIKAAALGLTSNVTFDANKSATRGDVAKMAQTLLNLNTVAWNTDANAYLNVQNSGSNVSLINKVYNTSVQTFVVSHVDTTNNVVQLKSEATNGDLSTGYTPGNLTANTYYVGAVNATAAIGHEVSVILDSNKNVLFMADNSVANSKLTSLTATASGTGSSATFSLADSTGAAVTNTVANVVYVLNGTDSTANAIAQAIGNGNSLTVSVVKNTAGNIFAIVANTYDEAAAVVTAKSVGATSSVLYFNDATQHMGSVTVDSTTTVTRDGQPSSLSAIQTGDVVMITGKNGQTATKVDAYSKQVSGTVSGVYTDSNGTKVTVNNTDYLLNSSVYNASAATPGFVSASSLASTVVGNAYTFTVGPNNTVYELSQTAAQSNEIVGYVTNVKTPLYKLNSDGSMTNYSQVTIFKTDGTTQTLNINDVKADGTAQTDLAALKASKGSYLDVTLDGNGDVTADTIGGLTPAVANYVAADTTNNKLYVDNNVELPVTSATKILDVTNATATTPVAPKLITLDKIGAKSTVSYSVDSTGALKVVLVTNNTGAVSTSTDVAGLYTGEYNTVDANGQHYFVKLTNNGTTTNYAVSPSVYSTVTSYTTNSLVKLHSQTASASYSYDTVNSPSSFATGTASNVAVTDNYFQLSTDASTTHYAVDSSTKVYIVDTTNNNAVTVGNIYDINNYSVASLGGSAKPISVGFTNVSTYGGTTYNHADVVVIKK